MKKLLVLSLTLILALLAAACAPEGANVGTETPDVGPGVGVTDEPLETQPLETDVVVATPAEETEELVITEVVETPDVSVVTPMPTEEIITVEPPVEDNGEDAVETAETPDEGTTSTPLTSEDLANFAVQTADGQQLGQIIDLVLNADTLDIDYIVATLENASGQTVAIPWEAFTRMTPEEAEAALTNQAINLGIDPAVLEQAPAIDLANIDLQAAEWDDELRAFWEPIVTSELGESLPQTGAEAQHLTLQALQSARVFAEEQGLDELGSIAEVIVDPQTGRVTHVVIQTGEALGIGEQLIPVPVEALTVAALEQLSGLGPELLVSLEALLNAPRLEEGQLPDDLLEGWDMELNLEEYWNNQP